MQKNSEMKIIYLGHSGFLIETFAAYYVFDYIRGELPEFSENKKIYVFVSHAHHDHWNSDIFYDDRLKKTELYILGFDIKEPFEKLTVKDPSLSVLPIAWAYPGQTIKTDDFTCNPILSTDEGVAFPVCTKEGVFYHAGDLNWWHWNKDPAQRNAQRAVNFKREVDRLKGLHIDAAFIPLDPRQENAYRYGMDYCMENLDMAHVFPMHFWENYELCHQYQESLKADHPDWYERFVPLQEGQETELS